MIDNNAVERMAREYQINPSRARRLLEKAEIQLVPALLRCREYQEAVERVAERRGR